MVLSSNTFSGRGTNGALEGFLLGELLSVRARKKERGGCDMIHNGVNVATGLSFGTRSEAKVLKWKTL